MQRRYERMYSPAIGRDMEFLAFGHYGPPVIAFPTGGGRFFDNESNGLVDAVRPWIEQGRLKLYCPDGIDHESWLNRGADLGWRAGRAHAYQDFIVNNLVPYIRWDCQTPDVRMAVTGCSFGAYHAVNFALKFPELFHYALGMSGRYDLEAMVGRADNMDVYFNNPLGYAYHLHGEALDRIRGNTHLVLVVGQGAWDEVCLEETNRLADIFVAKGISHERDVWGHDVEHHWYWWKKQIYEHFSRTLGAA